MPGGSRAYAALTHVYQPIVEIGGGLVGYEALVRIPGRDLGQVIRSLATEGPMALRRFDADALRSAVAGARRLPVGMRLFFNVTPATVHAAMEGSGWPDTGGMPVVWEIPEGREGSEVVLRDGAASALAGAEIALDDLGAGDSDLRRLAAFPGAWCKLDMRLVRNCHIHGGNAAVIRAVVQLASALGQRVIAEGVEQPEEEAALAEVGIRYAQGFLYGAPAALPQRVIARASRC